MPTHAERPGSDPMRTARHVCLMVAIALIATTLSACGADTNGDQITSPITTTQTSSGTSRQGTTATGGSRSGGGTSPTTSSSKQTLPGHTRPVVLLGDMNTDEQFVLGELYAFALRAAGFTVAVSRNIGPAPVTNEALKEHTLDIYPAYVNNLDVTAAGLPRLYRNLRTALAQAHRYARRHHLVLLTPTPFSNTTGLAVTAAYARSLHVYSLSALAKGPNPIVGVPVEYATAKLGLPLIERDYRLTPSYVKSVGIGLQYGALEEGKIQAAYVNSTDPQLDTRQYVLLSDPLHSNGVGNVVPVTTSRVIRDEGPAFVRAINRVDALLTLSAIRGLNAEVQIDNVDPAAAAKQFLQAHHVIPVSTG